MRIPPAFHNREFGGASQMGLAFVRAWPDILDYAADSALAAGLMTNGRTDGTDHPRAMIGAGVEFAMDGL
jgi:hypothetical protein